MPVFPALTVVSGVAYYRQSRRVVTDSLQGQAQALCSYVEHQFDMSYARSRPTRVAAPDEVPHSRPT